MGGSSDITEFDINVFVRDINRAICTKFGSRLEEIAENVVNTLEPIDLKTFLISCRSHGNYQLSFRNMFNAWYSECFLWCPSTHSMMEPTTGEIKMELNRYFETINKHFAGWRYVIAYYSIFFSSSAMLRAIDASYKGGHKNIIRAFNARFYSRRFPEEFMLFPFNAYNSLTSQNIFSQSFFSTIPPEFGAKKGEKISLLNLLYIGRQRINYYIISRFARTKKRAPSHLLLSKSDKDSVLF
jgi:uncharacterized protein (UPF0332 family)